MDYIQRTRLTIAASGLVNAIGKLNFPQGAYATYIGAVVLMLSNWIASNGSLIPLAWHVYLPAIIALLTGIHTISALAWPAHGSAWTVSAVWVISTQSLGILLQTANSLLSVAPPEWRDSITMSIQFLMGLQTMTSLHKEAS